MNRDYLDVQRRCKPEYGPQVRRNPPHPPLIKNRSGFLKRHKKIKCPDTVTRIDTDIVIRKRLYRVPQEERSIFWEVIVSAERFPR
jgi:hypothetical protein